jgi:hypothetical protein
MCLVDEIYRLSGGVRQHPFVLVLYDLGSCFRGREEEWEFLLLVFLFIRFDSMCGSFEHIPGTRDFHI